MPYTNKRMTAKNNFRGTVFLLDHNLIIYDGIRYVIFSNSLTKQNINYKGRSFYVTFMNRVCRNSLYPFENNMFLGSRLLQHIFIRRIFFRLSVCILCIKRFFSQNIGFKICQIERCGQTDTSRKT